MSGGLTILPPVRQVAGPTAIERAGRYLDCDAVPTGAVALGDAVFAGFGDGQIRIFRPDHAKQIVRAHDGPVLCLAPHDGGVLTGGCDGQVTWVSADGAVRPLARFDGHWVDCVAAAPNGAWAASAAKIAQVRGADGHTQDLAHPSTVGGLAFDRKGTRLAVAHYGGVTLWTRDARRWKPSALKWAGSHGAVGWSPDNRFVVTAMQENALHGWRVRDKADMRMTGYPAKVKSWAWVGALPHLATSGAQQAICWPFDGANGPMGRAPLMPGDDGDALVTAVAGLPGQDALLMGFETGAVLLSDLDPLAQTRVVKRGGGAPITHLVVTPGTGWLLAAAEDGVVLWAPLGRAAP